MSIVQNKVGMYLFGDEEYEDVIHMIRYFAENGAHAINLSVEKGYFPEKSYIDDLIEFADSLGVLMIYKGV